LAALSAVLTSSAGASLSGLLVGGATLIVVGGLWRVWSREQSARPSPISEYLAIGYGWAFYASLVVTWGSIGERWVEFLVLLPPISFVPWIIRVLLHRSSRRSVPLVRAASVLHRLAAIVFIASGAFFVLTVLGMVLAPVPLVAATLHLVAGRFYAQQRST
jgi:hypothetical protein